MIWCYSSKQCRHTLYSKIMSFLPSVIINKITWFSHLKLCFDLYASLIFLVFYGTNKILGAIVLLFCSRFFQPFECDGNSISFQLYWSIKGLFFDIFCGSFLLFWQFNATVKAYWKQLSSLLLGFIVLFLFFQPFRRIYIWSASFETYFWRW